MNRLKAVLFRPDLLFYERFGVEDAFTVEWHVVVQGYGFQFSTSVSPEYNKMLRDRAYFGTSGGALCPIGVLCIAYFLGLSLFRALPKKATFE